MRLLFSDEKEFVLEDSGTEAEFCFSFAKSLERARTKKVFEVRLTHSSCYSDTFCRWKEIFLTTDIQLCISITCQGHQIVPLKEFHLFFYVTTVICTRGDFIYPIELNKCNFDTDISVTCVEIGI